MIHKGRHVLDRDGICVLCDDQAAGAEITRLRDGLRFIAERVHQAYHDGPIESCGKATCQHACDLLSDKGTVA